MHDELFGKQSVTYKNEIVGTLHITREGLRAKFQSSCKLSTSDILRLTLQSDGRSIPLGVMFPDGEVLHFQKYYTKHDLTLMRMGKIDACLLIGLQDETPAPPARTAEPSIVKPAEPIAPPIIEHTAPPVPIEEIPTEIVPPTPEPAQAEPEAPLQIATDPAPEETPIPAEPELKEEPPTQIQDEPTPESQAPITTEDDHWEILNDWTPASTTEALFSSQSNAYPDLVPPEELVNPNLFASASAAVLEDIFVSPQTDWEMLDDPSFLFVDPELIAASRHIPNTLTRVHGDAIELAIPFELGSPFSLMPIFCFGQARTIEGQQYLVFRIKDGHLTQ